MSSNAVVRKRQPTDIPPHVASPHAHHHRDMQSLPPMTQPRLYSWHPQSLSSSAATSPDTSSIWFDNFGTTFDLPPATSDGAILLLPRPRWRLNLPLRRTTMSPALMAHRHPTPHDVDDDDDDNVHHPKSPSRRYMSRRLSRWSGSTTRSPTAMAVEDDHKGMGIVMGDDHVDHVRHSSNSSSNSSTIELPPASSSPSPAGKHKHAPHHHHSPPGRMAWTCFFPRNVDM